MFAGCFILTLVKFLVPAIQKLKQAIVLKLPDIWHLQRWDREIAQGHSVHLFLRQNPNVLVFVLIFQWASVLLSFEHPICKKWSHPQNWDIISVTFSFCVHHFLNDYAACCTPHHLDFQYPPLHNNWHTL